MTHLLRTQPDAVWKIGYDVSGADLIDIDEKSKKTINADDGGLWLPSASINVAGAGVGVYGPWVASGGMTNVTGDIEFDENSADDYFGFAPGHPEATPTAYQQLVEVYGFLPEQATSLFGVGGSFAGITTFKNGARFMAPLRARNSGRVTQVIIQWRTGENHTIVPDLAPRFRVYAVDASGNIFSLRAPDATTDLDGFQPDPTTSYSLGTNHNFAYVCNQNQIVDTSKFSYFLEVIDESGSHAWVTTGNTYIATRTTQDQVAHLDSRG